MLSRAQSSGMEEYPYPLTVEGPWPSTSTKTLSSKLQIYFQSKKKSQGGDCTVKICEQSGIATVLFKSEETRDQVLAKRDHSINIESQMVKLRVFKPGETEDSSGSVGTEDDGPNIFQQPDLQTFPDSKELGFDIHQRDPTAEESTMVSLGNTPQSSAVVLEKLPNNFSRDTLLLFLENISGLSEEEFSLELITESNIAVVMFNDHSVSEKFLLKSRSNKKIQQCGLIGRALEKCRSIKVENVPSQATKDLLELYFEKWGGAVESIAMIPEEQSAIVTFHCHDGVQKVLEKVHHIGQISVNVYPYFTSLGTALYGKDRPTWSLPKPFTEKIHPAIKQFLHKKRLISSICDQMSSYFCEVNMDKAEVQLSPLPTLLKQKGVTKTQIDGWTKNALDGFRTILSNYAVFEHTVMPSMSTTVEKDIQSIVKDKAFMIIDSGLLTLAGMAQDINLLKPILDDFLKKSVSQLEREKNTASDTLEISAAMFSLLLQEGFKHKALAKYPELKLTHKKDSNQLTLQGLPVEIVDVKNWIIEKIISIKQKSLNMDASLLEVLRSADCDEMSEDIFISKGISAIYKVENGDVIIMGSTDSALSEAEKQLQRTLTSRTLSLEDQSVLEKPKWHSLRNQLIEIYNSTRKKTVAITTSQNGDTLVVSGFRVPVSEVSQNLEMFINEHSKIFSLPKPFTEKIHPDIREFLLKKGLMSSICDQMSSYFCDVDMDKAEVHLSPLPTLIKQKELTKRQVESWKQNAIDGLRSILSNSAVFEHSVTPAFWSTIEKDIQSIAKDNTVLRLDNELLTLAGTAQDIELLRPILEDVLKKALNQMERNKNIISDSMEISTAMFSLLQLEELQSIAAEKYPELKLAHESDNQLTFQGLPVEIIDVKSWILKRKLSIKQKSLNMDASLLEFLRSAECDEMSEDLFTSKGISSVYKVENGDVVLMGSTDSALSEAERRLQKMLTSRTLSLEDQGELKKPEWRSLINYLIDTYNSSRKKTVVIVPSRNGDTLIVSGLKDPVSEVSRYVEMFLSKHLIEKVIRVKSCAVVKFMKEKKSEVWKKLVESNEVKVHFDPRRPLIRLFGELVHIQPVMENFQKIAKSLHTDRMIINNAGAKNFFQEQRAMFQVMVKEHRFVIVPEESHMLEGNEEDEDHYDSDKQDDFGQLSCKIQMSDGVTVTVRKADICQLKVDAVVNAANEDLKHNGGLSLALLKAAGPSLQEESDQYIARNGQVQPGNAITTGSGRLPCKYVVHAVGPRYSDTDKFTAVRRLRQAVRESLNQAVENKCSSIAVPAISSGIFGFPLELCSETIAKELYAYVEDPRHQGGRRITEIHLVDNNTSTVNAMAQAIRNEFADFNPEMTFPKHKSSYGAGNHGHGICGKSYRGHDIQGRGAYGHDSTGPRNYKPHIYRTKNPSEFKTQGGFRRQDSNHSSTTLSENWDRSGLLEKQTTQEGLRIILRKGNIQDSTSDVIINTIAEDVNLSSGAVTKALLSAAGPKLQSEARSYLTSLGLSKLNYGEIVDTRGYNLNCQKVFHAVCPFWNGGSGSETETLKQIIENCLKKAEHQKMSSLSFPALGTGNLRFPKDLVSSILLREIHDFSAKFTPQHLQEVTVVVHPSDDETVQSFRGGKPGPITKTAQASQQSSPKKSPAKPSESPGLFGVVSTPTLGVHKVQVGRVTLEVSSGDITKEKSDAIVNSSNSTFSLKSGVSKAILDAAGAEVEQECAQAVEGSVQQKEHIMTSGGQLPCKHIIHVIGRNSAAAISDVVNSVLKLCDENKFSSVAFPALGTGQGGISPSVVADAMIDAVIEFVKKKKAQHLQSVKFLIFQGSMVSDFHQSMMRRQQEGVEEDTTVMGWIKDDNPEASVNEDFVMVVEEFEPAVFQLCGESQQDLRDAKELINGFFVKEHTSLTFRDSAINHFSREDVEVLNSLQRDLTVSIHLKKSGPEGFITVEGLTRDVLKAERTIQNMIRKVDKNTQMWRKSSGELD